MRARDVSLLGGVKVQAKVPAERRLRGAHGLHVEGLGKGNYSYSGHKES